MSQLVESLKIQNAKLVNIEFHQARMNKSCNDYFGFENKLSLEDVLLNKLNESDIKLLVSSNSICKCRVMYDAEIRAVEIAPYKRKQVNSLKLVYDNTIEYSFKYSDRSCLVRLYEQKADCDDILIVKNNFVGDTSYSNVVFYDGVDWFTPKTCLLPGTQRAYLLQNGIIKEADIAVTDLKRFKKLRIVNAMISFDDEVDVLIDNIIY